MKLFLSRVGISIALTLVFLVLFVAMPLFYGIVGIGRGAAGAWSFYRQDMQDVW